MIYAANQGYLDRVEVSEVPNVNEAIRREVREGAPEVLEEIRQTKDLSDEAAAKLDSVVAGVAAQFASPDGERETPPADEAAETDEAEEAGVGRRGRLAPVGDPEGHQAADRLGPQHAQDHPRHGARGVGEAAARAGVDRVAAPYATAMRRLMAQAARQSGGMQGLALLQECPPRGRPSWSRSPATGLAGAFNVNIVRPRTSSRGTSPPRKPEVEYVTVGKKGTGTIRFRGLSIDRSFQGFSTEPTYADARQVAEHLVSRFTSDEVNRVVIVYNAFKSVLEQRVTTEQLLPIERAVAGGGRG